ITARHIQVKALFEEELLLVMNADHRLTHKKSIHASDIEQLPFVLLGEAHCLSDNVLAFCKQKAFHPVTVERTSQLSMVQELVSLGHGISLVPAMASKRDTNPSRVYRSIANPKPTRTLAMLTNPYRFQSRLVRYFQEHILEMSTHPTRYKH
ncbi:MAG TPA: LysR family transcriptional regulator substrate-binding protein, partial [Gemmatales bacterium]|nr:LysR family transcriptional regulator substrate-binding protein [Gemmatales bacterium]